MKKQFLCTFDTVLKNAEGRIMFEVMERSCTFTVNPNDTAINSGLGSQDYGQFIRCVAILSKTSKNSLSSNEFLEEYYEKYIHLDKHSCQYKQNFMAGLKNAIRATFFTNFAFPERHDILLTGIKYRDVNEYQDLLKVF